jgi:iron complex transport system substrate-binding protein
MNAGFRDIPRKIICLTEESVEALALLGRLDLVAGVSIFVKRPVEAQNLPKVSAFTSSKIDTIVDMKPDLVLGFSDIQKDIARELIGAGLNVWIANHRSLSETLSYVLMLGRMIGEEQRALALVAGWQRELEQCREETSGWKYRPKVYFEEWDEPQISAIQWVSELIEAAGGENIFADRAAAKLAQNRFCTNEEVVARRPDIVLGCWCGKRVRLDDFYQRPGWSSLPAIQNKQVHELPPEIFLQPGPALFVDGLRMMKEHLQRASRNEGAT